MERVAHTIEYFCEAECNEDGNVHWIGNLSVIDDVDKNRLSDMLIMDAA
jgi:hypothetical protein